MERQIMPQEVREANLVERARQMIIGKYKRYGIEFTENELTKLLTIINTCVQEDKQIVNKEFNGFGAKLWAEAEARFFYFEFGIDIIGYLADLGNDEATKSRYECLKANIEHRRKNKTAV
jgi:hypothetical protein